MDLLCRVEEIPEDNGLELNCAGADGPIAIAVFATKAGPRAYLNSCPHQGRSLTFAPGEFLLGERGELVCPHHGATFDLDSGRCLSGPCQGASLHAIELRFEQGRVLAELPPRDALPG